MAVHLVQPLLGKYNERFDTVRSAPQPFSQKFEHTDWTLRAQSIALQSMNGGRGLIGTEAGMMAARYGRR